MNHQLFQSLLLPSVTTIALALPSGAIAQIIPDQTLPTNSSVAPDCVQCVINGGTIRGVNLYHSFQEFSVPTNGSAWFNNGGTIQNILTRVTGSAASTIDGLLRTNGTANLFFLNPNGIVFGANARLQIGGSFFASTASSLRFADGSEFSATNPQAPPLLTVNITPGLQYGTVAPGTTITQQGRLTAGQDLTLVGDRVLIQGDLHAGRDLVVQAADLVQVQDSSLTPVTLQAGRLLQLQGDRTLTIDALNHPMSGLWAGGDLVLRSQTAIGGDAHYTAGGNFRIETLSSTPGDFLSPKDPVIRAQGDVSFNNYTGASLHILAGGSVIIPGTIFITAPDGINGLVETVPLSDGTLVAINGRTQPTLDIRAGTTAVGTPLGVTGGVVPPPTLGTVPTTADIQIGTIFTPTDQEGRVLLTNRYQPNGLPGNITVGRIDTSIIDPVAAEGGAVFMDSRGDIRTGGIDSSALIGRGGEIRLLAQGAIALQPNTELFTSSFGAAPSGAVMLTANTITIPNAEIYTSALGTGAPGAITLNAPAIVLTQGNLTAVTDTANFTGAITLNSGNTGSITLQDQSIVLTLTIGSGNAGNIHINTGTLQMSGGATVTASTQSSGQAGKIEVIANSIDLSGTGATPPGSLLARQSSGLLSEASSGSTGNAGAIAINTGRLQIRDGAVISTSAAEGTTGRGGDLTIQADAIVVSGTSPDGDNRSSLLTATVGTGDAGNITLTTRELRVQAGGVISSSTLNQGRSGRLTAISDSIIISGTAIDNLPSALATSTGGTGAGGDLILQTRQVSVLDGALISAATYDRGTGGNLVVTATEVIDLAGRGADGRPGGLAAGSGNTGYAEVVDRLTRSIGIRQPLNTANASGNGGTIQVTTPSLNIREGAIISTETIGAGSGGAIALTTNTLGLDTAAQISASTTGRGNAGAIAVTTQRLTANNGGSILTTTSNQGNAGNLLVSVQDHLSLNGQNTRIAASTAPGSTGQGGSLVVAANTVALNNGAELSASTAGSGAAGSVSLQASQLTGDRGARITSSTNSSGAGGSLAVSANTVVLNNGAEFSASTSGTGAAGNLLVSVQDHLSLNGQNTRIAASTAPGSTGQGGSLVVAANTVALNNGAELSASTAGSGAAGSVNLQASQLTGDRGARITSSTSSSGAAGDIAIAIREALRLSGEGTGVFASTTAGSSGTGGNIFTTASTVQIESGAAIAVDSQGSGSGGNIALQANRLELNRRGSITAETASTQGGNITLDLRDILLMRRNSTISATAGTAQAEGDGGNIIIRAPFIIGVLGENSDITANAFTGRGGNITITTNAIFGLRFRPQLTPFSDITASSQFGVNGTVAINTLGIDPNRGLVTLPANFADPSRQITQDCTPGSKATASSFTVTGRGGIPESPLETLHGSSDRDLWVTVPTSERDRPTVKSSVTPQIPPIVEAQHIVIGADGVVELVAHAPNPPQIPLPICAPQRRSPE